MTRPTKIRERLPQWPGDLVPNAGSYGLGDTFMSGKPPGHAVLEEASSRVAPTGKKFVEMQVSFAGRNEVSRLTADAQDADRLTTILNRNSGQTLDYIANLEFTENCGKGS